MTKKDYILIAEAIKEAKTILAKRGYSLQQVAFVQDELAKRLSNENPRFNWSKFEKACSIEE